MHGHPHFKPISISPKAVGLKKRSFQATPPESCSPSAASSSKIPLLPSQHLILPASANSSSVLAVHLRILNVLLEKLSGTGNTSSKCFAAHGLLGPDGTEVVKSN